MLECLKAFSVSILTDMAAEFFSFFVYDSIMWEMMHQFQLSRKVAH